LHLASQASTITITINIIIVILTSHLLHPPYIKHHLLSGQNRTKHHISSTMQPQLLLLSLISLTFTSVYASPIPFAMPSLSGRDLPNVARLASLIAVAAEKREPSFSWTEHILASLAEERCGELAAGKRCA